MSSNISKPIVLIADPDESYQEIMTDLLSQRMDVLTASTVQDALDICWEQEIDLIISEIEMPGESAEAFFEKVKRKMPNTMIVVITQGANVDNAVRALRLGAIDFIQKPFTVEDIALLIEKFYSLTVNKKSDYDLLDTIVEEQRTFSMPTDFHLINPFLNELLDMIKRFATLEKKTMLSIRLSIYEMLVNAMEHGNLEISYEDKKLLLEKIPDYQKYLQEKAASPQFRNKKVILGYHIKDNQLRITIEDEGNGFDVTKLPSPVSDETLSGLNGRGIFITRVNMDELIYNEKGNQVTLVKNLKEEPAESE